MTDDKLRAWHRWPLLRRRPPIVPVIRLSGVIGAMSLRGAGLSFNTVNPALERGFKVRGAKAVALAINCPGGSPVQTALIAERIRALAAERELPVLAFIEDVGASGGYWLALAADEIFADASSIVGSIGVIHASFGFAEAIQRLGIERRLQTAGAKKALLDPFRARDPDDVARLQVVLDEIHAGFKQRVRERRGSRLKAADAELFEGQIWTGRGALEAGLIDGLGTLHGILRARYGVKLKLPHISSARPWWQRRLGLHGNRFETRAILDGVLDSLAERALWERYGL
ncbi:MAG: S49 family peptidase [Geminicoccaceae bacterium]